MPSVEEQKERLYQLEVFKEMVDPVLAPHCSSVSEVGLIRNAFIMAGFYGLNLVDLKTQLQNALIVDNNYRLSLQIDGFHSLGERRISVIVNAFGLSLPTRDF